jgi:hypothetical protein
LLSSIFQVIGREFPGIKDPANIGLGEKIELCAEWIVESSQRPSPSFTVIVPS